jgi:hypothetical protein
MGERKAESASARGLHRLKGLPLASAGGRAWGVALGVSSVVEGYLEDWVRRAAFTVTLYRSGLRSVTYVSKFCKPLDLKQSDYNMAPINDRRDDHRYRYFRFESELRSNHCRYPPLQQPVSPSTSAGIASLVATALPVCTPTFNWKASQFMRVNGRRQRCSLAVFQQSSPPSSTRLPL